MHNQIAIDNIAHYTLNNHNLTPLRGKIPVLKNWTDRETINNERLEKYIKDGMNLGWVLGDCDLVVDVDPRNGGDKSFIQLEKDIGIKLHKTVKTIGGFHCYLKYSGGLKLHKKVAKYPGIDFLTQGNQCVIAGSTIVIKGKLVSYDWHDDNVFACFEQHDTPKKLIDILLDGSVNPKGGEGAATICDLGDFDDLVGTDNGNWTDASVLVHLRKLDPSMKNDEWVKVGMALHSYHPVEGLKLWEYWSIEGDNYKAGECETRWASFDASGSGVSMGTLVHMAVKAAEEVKEEEREGWDGWIYVDNISRYMQIESLAQHGQVSFNLVAGDMVPENEKGNRVAASTYIVSKQLLQSVNHLEYRPALSEGIHTEDDVAFLNSFRRKSVPPTAEIFTDAGLAAIDVIREHFKFICTTDKNAEILMKWIAFQVQNKGEKITWAPLIQGIQGCGKSIIGLLIRELLGRSNVGTVSPAEINSGFNQYATGVSVNILEEISIRGHNRYDVTDAIKPLVTNDEISINGKGLRPFNVRNVTNYILFTNNKTSIPVDEGERRYWVIFAPITNMSHLKNYVGMDAYQYFTRLANAIENNPSELRKFFMEIPLDDSFNNAPKAPDTEHRTQMIMLEDAGQEGLLEARAMIDIGGEYFCKDVVSSQDLFAAVNFEHGINISTRNRRDMMLRLDYRTTGNVKINGKSRLIWLSNNLKNTPTAAEIREILKKNEATNYEEFS